MSNISPSTWRAAAFTLLLAFPGLVTAGENYAFLVAVSDYDRTELKPLKFTRADLLAFRQTLVDSGFKPANIVHLHDDTAKLSGARFLSAAQNIREELSLLLGTLDKDDTLIVAFAGHGIQFKGEPESYFCPRDTRLAKRDTLISFADVLAQMDRCAAARKLLLVDACRNDPQTALARSRAEVDLESVTRPQEVDVPKSLLALFSCGPGQQSFEDPELGHGIFFHHVLKGWKGAADGNKDNRLEFDELQSYVRAETKKYARVALKSLQTPQLKGAISDEWTLTTLKPSSAKSLTSKSSGMRFVLIPAGKYVRGSPNSDPDSCAEEKPQHVVRISRDFYLGQHEVTQGEWRTVMGTEPWKGEKFVVEGKDYPATFVNWDDTQEFCRRLGQKDGRAYRLPTEAEWEYAARAGTSTRFSFGDDARKLGDYGWFGALFNNGGNAQNEPFAHAVGLKRPNDFQLFDMHGNAYEWVQDGFDPAEYARYAGQEVEDPFKRPTSTGLRVMRSGAWFDHLRGCRSAYRGKDQRNHVSNSVGFRVASDAVER